MKTRKMMEEAKKKTIIREALRFGIYFVLVFLFSIYSATRKTVVGGVEVTDFFMNLFFLNLISWVIIYAIVRGAVWLVKNLFQK
ncbi:hypothetical protein ACFL4E_01100 [Candidatus Omnitrophota bacterium]